MERKKLLGFLALQASPGIGPRTFRKLLETRNPCFEELLDYSVQNLLRLGLNQIQAEAINSADKRDFDPVFDWLDFSTNHHLITLLDDSYPELLRQIADPPPVIYANGNIDLLHQPQIAIVGSRNCSPGGAQTARAFSSYLCESGITITSGLALGIDQHAHLGALAAGGSTIAVIGTGIDRIYPAKNRDLAHQITAQGLMISEFPLGTAPIATNFPKRNRIISGLSMATLVVEAASKSGSLITARQASEQGREVFAIPGSIHNPHAKGCHQLIRDGAKLVDQAADIIDDIGSLLGFVAQQTQSDLSSEGNSLDHEYQSLLELVGYDPVSVDTLAERSGLTIEQLSSMLLILELNNHIQPVAGGLYTRC